MNRKESLENIQYLIVKEFLQISQKLNNKCQVFVNTLSFNVHFNMVSIHPFSDGNGRLSRLLMNYVQMYHNKPLSIVFQVDKIDYFNVLEQSRKEESIKPFNDFMYAQSLKHFKAQINDLKPKNNKNLTMLF